MLVDVWHCDALGNYSDVGRGAGHDYLRGYQHTDANGKATITTIYPGWYQGRAVHIHFKIRTDADAASGLEFTSQLFFDDAFSAQVYASGVYASKGTPDQLERDRRHLPAEPGDDAARRGGGRRRLQGDLRDRGPGDLNRTPAMPRPGRGLACGDEG